MGCFIQNKKQVLSFLAQSKIQLKCGYIYVLHHRIHDGILLKWKKKMSVEFK